MNKPDQPILQVNEAQQRINNILTSNNFLLISGTGEVLSQNIPLEAILPLLESVKASILTQLIKHFVEQQVKASQSNP